MSCNSGEWWIYAIFYEQKRNQDIAKRGEEAQNFPSYSFIMANVGCIAVFDLFVFIWIY